MSQRSEWLTDHAEVGRCFPESHDRIVALASESEEFRALCEEYQLARDALCRFEKAGEAAQSKCQDYRNLVRDLERDLASMLAGKK